LTDKQSFVDDYIHSTKLKLFFILMMGVLSVFCIFLSLSTEAAGLTFDQCVRYVLDFFQGITYDRGTPDYYYSKYMIDYKAPRVVFAVLAGAGLAVAGVAMQSVMNNPLADPYTTGLSSGACFGVALGTCFGFIMGSQNAFESVVFSFIFSLIPTTILLMIAPKAKISPSTLILAGVAISYLFNAMTTLLLVTTDSGTLAQVYQWQVGTISGIPWSNVELTAVIVVIGSIIIWMLSRSLNVLSLGDSSALSLGLDPEALRVACLMVISFLVAVIVGSAGILGFVGLMAPHIVRLLVGSDNRFVIPMAIMFSACFLLVCDVASLIMSPLGAIPIGTVVSMIGAPIFLLLIIRRNSNVW